MYKCFVKDKEGRDCGKDSIVCYGNGGMGEPARCVCVDHAVDDIRFLYKRLQILNDINEKLVGKEVLWKRPNEDPPQGKALWLGLWSGREVIGLKKEETWYYFSDSNTKIDEKVICWAEITLPNFPDWFNEDKWKKDDA